MFFVGRDEKEKKEKKNNFVIINGVDLKRGWRYCEFSIFMFLINVLFYYKIIICVFKKNLRYYIFRLVMICLGIDYKGII